MSKGYSKWYAALVPLMWITTEFTAMFLMQVFVPDADFVLLMFVGVAGGAVGGAIVYWRMRLRVPQGAAVVMPAAGTAAPGAPAPPVTQAPGGSQALAGYCEQCGTNTWLTPEGACERGHDADSVSGVYWALRR